MEDKWTLRPYQQECKEILDNTPTGKHLVVMATGLGKTVVLTHLKRNGRVLLLSHRDELVRQPEKYFDCTFGIEKAGEHSHGEEVVSASIQSLSQLERLHNFSPTDFDTIIIDEAHHSAAKTYRQILEYFSGAKRRIGFTATPQRGDNVRLTDVFDDIVFNRDLRWGIQNNYLSRIRCEQVRGDFSLKGIKKYRGDFAESQLEALMEKSKIIPIAAKTYVEKCLGRHTLIYCVTKKICAILESTIKKLLPQEEQDTVCVLTGTTPAEKRKTILEDFSSGKIRCIINCMVLTEGTDLPICDTIMNLRPTCNMTLYQQMAGRGTRLYEGKDYCLLIDIVPDDIAEERNLCIAPSLLGVDPALLSEEQRKKLNPNTDLLDLCDDICGIYASAAQKIDLEIRNINLFLNSFYELVKNKNTLPALAEEYSTIRNSMEEYDFGDLDMEVHPGDEKHFSIKPNWNEIIYISKPDVLDNVLIEFHLSDGNQIVSGNLKMNNAILLARAYCTIQPDYYSYCWSKKSQERWKKMNSTEKQHDKLRNEYTKRGINTDYQWLNKLDASRLIDLSLRVKKSEKRKKLLEAAGSDKKTKTVQKAKDTIRAEEEAEKLSTTEEEFLAFQAKILKEYNKKTALDRLLFSEINSKKEGTLKVKEEILSFAQTAASPKQLSYASSLLEQAEKNGCIFPKMELSSFKMREVSAMISALKEINKSFKYVQDDAKFEFFDFPAVVKSAENISGESTFVFHYRRIN